MCEPFLKKYRELWYEVYKMKAENWEERCLNKINEVLIKEVSYGKND